MIEDFSFGELFFRLVVYYWLFQFYEWMSRESFFIGLIKIGARWILE